MLIQKGIISRAGDTLKTDINSICVHSDTPNSIEISEQICILLEEMKIKQVTLPEFF
jgi:lactam utilization protein B